MRCTGIVLASLLLILPLGLFAGEAGKLREIDLKRVEPGGKFGKVTEPRVIASAEDLDKSPILVGDKVRETIKKQVDFTREKLVLFYWGGSGGDKLSVALKDKSATFSYSPGLTRDLRPHLHLFAIPKDAEVKVEKSGG